jgi:hypothetical protein
MRKIGIYLSCGMSKSTLNIRFHVAPGEHMVPGPFHLGMALVSGEHFRFAAQEKSHFMINGQICA